MKQFTFPAPHDGLIGADSILVDDVRRPFSSRVESFELGKLEPTTA